MDVPHGVVMHQKYTVPGGLLFQVKLSVVLCPLSFPPFQQLQRHTRACKDILIVMQDSQALLDRKIESANEKRYGTLEGLFL